MTLVVVIQVNQTKLIYQNKRKETIDFDKGYKSKRQISKHKTIKAISIPEDVNPRAIHQALNMTQEKLSVRYGFNLYTLRNWKLNRRHLDTAVLAYLYALSKNPQQIEDSLRS
ncbi:helix-turn-helix domain-containing protein [Candidatus Paracaedibacter symbiosus]|uniref:helix-turn-helix domain-containing protein n=1 Tax=Candidatus Paracaedibacter symbiosus TaxID=244582 RepID=UPI0012EBB6C4|nr:hypothetical protein [Candidatus Paracaedibacter symbiosus]